MKMKTLVILAAAAAVSVVLAVAAVLSQPRVEGPDVAGDALLPGLADRLNNLRSVAITQSEGTFTFDFADGQWLFRERDNYPADGEKIAGVVIRAARMVKLEAKTAQPDLYERLDLQDPTAEGSRSKQVTLRDADGNEMASLIVGKRKFTLGSKEGGTYVRLPGDPQTWLALGDLAPGAMARDWVRRDVVDIKDAAINRVTVTHPDGEKVVVSRDAEGAFVVENLPKDAALETPSAADEYARVLSALLMDDVDKAEDVPFPADGTTTAVFAGADGFTVTMETAEIDGKVWIKLRGAAGEKPQVEQAAQSAADPAATATDWAAVMADLNARTGGWAYQVLEYEVAVLKKRLADLVKKPEEKS